VTEQELQNYNVPYMNTLVTTPPSLKCLIRNDTIRWWAELSNSRRIRPYLNMDPVVKLSLTISLYDLNRK